jgi:hypothetical protein
LKETGYPGPLIIEREVPAAQIRSEVKAARSYLEKLLA